MALACSAALLLAAIVVVTVATTGSAPRRSVAMTGSPASSAAAPPSSSAPVTSAAPAQAPVNPLTGLAPVPSGPVVAVKIDDTANARPQRGTDQADVVYIEQAEGGLTRLLAVFATTLPKVEAVRSTRASDPELLAQYGPIDFVASGGAANPLEVMDASPLKTSINDRSGPGFNRDPNRDAPYNVVSDLSVVAHQLLGAGVGSAGFTFGAATGLAATPASTLSTQVGSTDVEFDWDPGTGRYVRVINGTRQVAQDGNPIGGANVVVQFCSITPYLQDVDVNGNASQYTHTIGSGQVSVFRGGTRIDGTWSRPSAGAGTTLASASGAPLLLAPGPTWVVLVATGSTLRSSP